MWQKQPRLERGGGVLGRLEIKQLSIKSVLSDIATAAVPNSPTI